MQKELRTYCTGVSKQASTPKVFDPTKLEAMTEPLSIRVEKIRGQTRTPIPLPPGEDGSPQGDNWSKEDVKGLEQWLVTDWSGGGMYTITVTDSSLPAPLKHDWTIFYNPTNYPEKVPPSLSSAAVEPRLPSATPLQPPQVRPMGSFPSVFPNGFPAQPAQPAQPIAPATPLAGPTYYQSPFYPAQIARNEYMVGASATSAADAERRRLEDQVKLMSEALNRAREEQIQANHRQELERAEARMRTEAQAQNERFSKLEQLIAQMAQGQARPAVDPAIEQLKEQNRMLAERAEAERRERETERRERETRDLIVRQQEEARRAQEESRRQMELLQQQFMAQIQAAQSKNDPMILFMQESNRQQVEAVREQARQQTAQMERLQSMMMHPRDIMAMAKESASGIDQTTRQITNTYQDILQMQRQVVDQVLQMSSGGGDQTMALIEKGLERASSFAERFVASKTKEAVTAQQTQAQVAQAQASAMQAQAQALQAQAVLRGKSREQLAGAAAASQGLNGAQAAPAPAPVTPAAPAVPDQPGVKRAMGRTDVEWFGPLLPKVTELREGVARFMESIQKQPPRLNKDGSVDGIEPEQAASAILQAINYVMAQQLPIAAMNDLLGQGRIADFMDVLLPQAPQPYRDEVAQMVIGALNGDDGDEDEDEDEDEGAEDGGPAEVVEAAPAGLKNGKAQARA